MPTTPQSAAGWRMEAPGSEPRAERHSPAAGGGGRGAAGGATGHALEVPGVVCGEKGRVFGRRAHGELIHVGLAYRDSAGGLEEADNVRVVDGDEVLQHAR